MKIIYRISDAGYNKVKPSYINNENCLRNALHTFPNESFYIIADNTSEATDKIIGQWIVGKNTTTQKVSEGNGAKTFNLALDYALKQDDNEIIYFLENDYFHKPNSSKILKEGFETGAKYVSLYDHPDKYRVGENPFVEDGGEVTRVMLTESCHWKLTNSTTMTFASKVKTLKEDENILRKHTTGIHPYDFQMFLELREKGRSLVTPIPGYSTHGETACLSPLTDWFTQC